MEEEDETNFLPLPEIRIPGIVFLRSVSGPRTDTMQTGQLSRRARSFKSFKGEKRGRSDPVIGSRTEGKRYRGSIKAPRNKYRPPLTVNFGLRSKKQFGKGGFFFSSFLTVSLQTVQTLKANSIKCSEGLFVFHHRRLFCERVSAGQGEVRWRCCCCCSLNTIPALAARL